MNSQSGKGGVAYLLESEFGIALPKDLQREFGPIANELVDRLGREVTGDELRAMFLREYVERTTPWRLESFGVERLNGTLRTKGRVTRDGATHELAGEGNGPIAAFCNALNALPGGPQAEVAYYSEHALGTGSEASAITYIQLKLGGERTVWGAAVDTNIELASIKAILSALNRAG